jgi:methionyl-tRNA formyltransferase
VKLRVLLVGQEAAGNQILRALAKSAHHVVAVLTQEPVIKGGPASLAGAAELLNVQVLEAGLVRDPSFAESIRQWNVDVLLNVHSLHVIARNVLASPRVGAFNLHPGPLPEYAGLNTIGWAIYNGVTEYAVTVHWMAPLVDSGPIAFAERFPVHEAATALSLSGECTRRGVRLLLNVLDHAAIRPDRIPKIPQDLACRRYYARGDVPQGGRIDWLLPAAQIARLARAFDYGPFASPWGRPFMQVGPRRLDVVGLKMTGETADTPAGTFRLGAGGCLEVASADEWVSVRRVYLGGTVIEPADVLTRPVGQ